MSRVGNCYDNAAKLRKNQNAFEWGGQVPVKGLRRVRLIVLGAVLVYQLTLLYQHQHNLPLGKYIKPLLRAA